MGLSKARFAPQIHAKTASEVAFVSVDFTGKLALSGETISGTPTVTASSSVLTISSVSANTSGTIIINGTTVAADKAVTFLATAGTTGVTYVCEVTISTNKSQTRNIGVRIPVIADPMT